MTFELHPSSLPTLLDCEGRWAASNIKELRKNLGKSHDSVGSVFGTIAHEAVAEMLNHKMKTGIVIDFQQVVLKAQRKFDEAFSKTLLTDATTRTRQSAHRQLDAVIRESWHSYVPLVKPLAVEQEMEIEVNELLTIKMRPDAVVWSPDGPVIDDHKFARFLGGYTSQQGGYIKAWEAITGEKVSMSRIQFIKRVGESSAPANLLTLEYRRESCLEAFDDAVKRVLVVVPEWQKTGNMRVFRKNSNSKFCTESTCRLWGTNECNQWQDTKGVA